MNKNNVWFDMAAYVRYRTDKPDRTGCALHGKDGRVGAAFQPVCATRR